MGCLGFAANVAAFRQARWLVTPLPTEKFAALPLNRSSKGLLVESLAAWPSARLIGASTVLLLFDAAVD